MSVFSKYISLSFKLPKMNFKITFFIFSIFEIYADVSASQIADANADKLNVRKVYGPQTGSIRSIDFN